jgi:hypothetical protein
MTRQPHYPNSFLGDSCLVPVCSCGKPSANRQRHAEHLIGMYDGPPGTTALHCHHHRVHDKAAVYRRPSGPSDDFAGKQIHAHGQIQPTFPSADIGDV